MERLEENAPVDFLSTREQQMLNKDGAFRPGLYCMLLSVKFSEAIENKKAFIESSLSFAFDQS